VSRQGPRWLGVCRPGVQKHAGVIRAHMSAMRASYGFVDAFRDIVDRFSAVTTSACGGSVKEGNKDSGLGSVFILQPLPEAELEASRHTQRGVRLLHEGRTDEALEELHNARQQAPRCLEACSNLGCAYHMSGDDNAALYWYRQAHCYKPQDETAVLAVALLEQRRGQVGEAQKMLVRFLSEVNASHVGALRQLGRLHQQQGHWSQAGGCFHRLISIEPSNNEWPAQLQMCLDQLPLKNDKGEAIPPPNGFPGVFARAFSFAEPILRNAVPMDSMEANATGFRGTYPGHQAANLGRMSNADSQFAAAAPNMRNDCGSPMYSLRSMREEGPHQEQSVWAVTQCFQMGAECDEDRFATVARVLDKSQVNSVGNVVEQLNRGTLQCPEGYLFVYSASTRAYLFLYRADKKEAAYLKFKQITEQAPAGTAVQLQEAARLRGSGKSDAALLAYKAVLRTDYKNEEALLGVADCQCDLGDIDGALEAGKQLIGTKPDSPEANMRVAELLLAAGHHTDMVEPYLKRVAADARASRPPLNHRLLCASAEASLGREDYTKALTNVAEAVRIDSSPRALILLGAARLRVAEYPAALRALAAALDACQGNPCIEARRLRSNAHMLTAQAHERLRQYPQALAQAQAALDLRPKFSDARVVKALALQQSGRHSEAERELEAVLRHDAQNATAQLQLGYMQLVNGDARAASTLEVVITGTAASRSLVGAAKVYMALALDSPEQNSSQRRSEKVLKEGLSLHRNLQHVWHEIETGLASQPLAAVQRLRGICDLDLTSLQAKQLLRMLAQVMGRTDIQHALAQNSPQQQRPERRAPSVPPNRWAPTSSSEAVVATSAASSAVSGPPRGPTRSVSPGPWGLSGSHVSMQRVANRVVVRESSPQRYRGRSGSPARTNVYCRPASQDTSASRGRQYSPMPGQAGTNAAPIGSPGSHITLAWDEVIRPEQLTFGPQLGVGGSGSVYRGSWNGFEVAIKKISGVAHLEEMKKEINALRRLRHPRLVRFMGACIQPPQLLVVTEFMSGGSLHDRIFGRLKDPALTQPQRWQICLQMAEGLAFLHANRVVHRDLKSMNILLDSAQNAKICDFGLAQQMEATHIARKTDGEGGSPRYMAPECYEASYGKLTEKVDIWAMGCIFIELFGNILPYSDCTTMAQLSARILVERKPPEIPAIVPAPLAEVGRRCLQFDERRRINAGDLHAELGKVRRQLKM